MYIGVGSRLHPRLALSLASGNGFPLGAISTPDLQNCVSLAHNTVPYSDSTAARTLSFGITPATPNSIESCTDACFNAGYPLAGTEYADECYCGLTFSNGGAPTPLTDCNMACSGNGSEFCGGPNRLNVRTLLNRTYLDAHTTFGH